MRRDESLAKRYGRGIIPRRSFLDDDVAQLVEQLRKCSEQIVESMSGYVYVLKSGRNERYYVGSTDHLIRRYYQHARGAVHTTLRMLPVTVEGWKEFETVSVARHAERELKRRKSRAVIEHWLDEQSLEFRGQRSSVGRAAVS
jgi:predicted GIY-YIG superfamily endonuclease